MFSRLVFIFCVLLFAGCQKHAVVPPTTPDKVAPAPVAEPVADRPTMTYLHTEDYGPRVYLPLDSPQCQADDSDSVAYLAQAMWRFEKEANNWVAVDIGTPVSWRIACNAMVDLADITGLDLEVGTYVVAATIDGKSEHGILRAGTRDCAEQDVGEAPAGKAAVCIVSANGAEMRFVPDPADLQP